MASDKSDRADSWSDVSVPIVLFKREGLLRLIVSRRLLLILFGRLVFGAIVIVGRYLSAAR